MKIESIKKINITLLFSGPINHSLISQQDLLNLFRTGDAEKDKYTFIDAPGLRVFILPNQQKEIIFEANRILINDRTGKSSKDSEVVNDLQRLLDTNLLEKDKIIAYGFNYDVIAIPSNGSFEVEDLIGKKIITIIKEIKKAGINISFEKDGVKYLLNLNILEESGKKFLALINVHFDISELPNFITLKEKILKEYKNFEEIIQKL